MEASYEVRKTHLVDFSMYNIKNSKEIKRIINIQRFLTPLIFFIICFIIGKSSNELTKWLIVFGALYISWVIIYPMWYMKAVKKNIQKDMNKASDQEVVGNCTLRLEESGVIEESNTRVNETKWKNIEKLVETQEYLFVYNTENSAYVVPKEAFASESDKEDYTNMLKKYSKKELEQWK
ncbi:YcxB family protein [Gottschalkia acidurici]|nr:YcxB family protein [Gottschalkia acidurici]